jgi:hypothetical protein
MLLTALILTSAIISAVAAVTAAYFSWQDTKRSQKIELDIRGVHVDVNSRLTELIALAGTVGRVEGAADALKADKVSRGESSP